MDLKKYGFKSNYEAQQAFRLMENSIKFEYEAFSIPYEQPVRSGECKNCGDTEVVKHRVYTPDFYFPEYGIIVETKGKFDAPGRGIIENVLNSSDNIDLRMVFMRDNYLTKRKSMKYSRWCEIRGIPYAVGDIPLEWFETEE